MLTFDRFDQLAAEHACREAAHNTPAAVACRALEALRAALDACEPAERREVLQLVRDELDLPVCDFAA